jgi:hypothetical protein
MSTYDASQGSRRRALIALLVVLAGSLVVLAMLGSQVSGILSTVGASVGGYPYGGGDAGGGTDSSGSGTGSRTGGTGRGVIPGAPRDDLLIIKTGELSLQVDAIGAEQQAQFDPADEVEAASASLIGVLQDVATAGI